MTERQHAATSLPEVRAWIGVGIAIFLHTVGMVWWAATLSAEVRQLQTLLVDQKGQYSILEARVRALEIRGAGVQSNSPR
jgi:hypothetical protein